MKHVQVRLSDETHERLQELCKERGLRSLQAVLSSAIASWIGESRPVEVVSPQEKRFMDTAYSFYTARKGEPLAALFETTMKESASTKTRSKEA